MTAFDATTLEINTIDRSMLGSVTPDRAANDVMRTPRKRDAEV